MKLYRHQQVALNYLRFNPSFCLCMEQGTGKTLPALARVLELFKEGEINNCLVVCPKAVMGSWYRDIEKFSQKEQKILSKITIINYDKVWRGLSFWKCWDCIILDEAHCIKNRASKRASFLLKLSVDASYRYLLTGTPISNGQLENLWSLICFLKPYKNGRSICSEIFKEHDGGGGTYYEWCDKYAYLDQFHKPYKYRRVNELQSIFSEYSFRVKKSQCLDLPAKLPDELIELELVNPRAKKIYKEIAKDSASIEMNFVAENPLVRLTKLRQLASGFFIDTTKGEIYDYGSEKDTWLKDYLEYNTEKLVIFAEFKHSIANICEMLAKLKIKYVVLDGNQKDKTIWREFQNKAEIRVIVCQYQSACQGIDLFSSSTIIYYEPTLRSSILEQSRDRIHRNGQHHPCSYIHLITEGTVEPHIYKALQGYSDFNEALFTKYLEEYQRSKR